MNKSLAIFITILILVVGIFGVMKMTGKSVSENTKVKLETTYGDIVIELYKDKSPITTQNFLRYVDIN